MVFEAKQAQSGGGEDGKSRKSIMCKMKHANQHFFIARRATRFW